MVFNSNKFRLISATLSLFTAIILFALISKTDGDFLLSRELGLSSTERANFENTIIYGIYTVDLDQVYDSVPVYFSRLNTENLLFRNVENSRISMVIPPNPGTVIMLSDVTESSYGCFIDQNLNIIGIENSSTRSGYDPATGIYARFFTPRNRSFMGKNISRIEIGASTEGFILSCEVSMNFDHISFTRSRMNLQYALPGDVMLYNINGIPRAFVYQVTRPSINDRVAAVRAMRSADWSFNIRDGENIQFNGGLEPVSGSKENRRNMISSSIMFVYWESASMKEWKELIWVIISSLFGIFIAMIGAAIKAALSRSEDSSANT